jgi:hypothetical protein
VRAVIPVCRRTSALIVDSEAARRRLARVEAEIARLQQQQPRRAAQSALAPLYIRRNLLEAVLQGRAAERDKKVVSLERWRFGFLLVDTARRLAHLLEDCAVPGAPPRRGEMGRDVHWPEP